MVLKYNERVSTRNHRALALSFTGDECPLLIGFHCLSSIRLLFMMTQFMIAYLSAAWKMSLESNCHIYPKDVWILEEAVLVTDVYKNLIEQK